MNDTSCKVSLKISKLKQNIFKTTNSFTAGIDIFLNYVFLGLIFLTKYIYFHPDIIDYSLYSIQQHLQDNICQQFLYD